MICYTKNNTNYKNGFIYVEDINNIKKFLRSINQEKKIDLIDNCIIHISS